MRITAAGVLLLVVVGVWAAAQSTLKTDVDLVSMYFTVRDNKGRLATNLEKDDFKVFEDGQPQKIRFVGRQGDVPLNVGVLLDVSTSLSRTLGLEADAASHFFRSVMRANDFGFLVSYASRIQALQVPVDDAGRLAEKAQIIRRD